MTITLGSTPVTKMYLGGTQLSAVYLGVQSLLGAVAPLIPLAPLRMILVSGQSLSIGTMTQATQPAYPTQPELSDRMKTFNGVSPAGNTTSVTSDAQTASLVQYEELTGGMGAMGYYTHGVGALKYLDAVDDAAQDWLWAPAGVGGATITQVDSGGAYASYANQQKMLARAKVINPDTDVTAIFFSQGESNWSDATPLTYYNKLVTYKANQLAAVAAQFPTSNPKFLIDQHGDGRASQRVHQAQADAARAGLAVVVGPKYWLNRNYPNAAGAEQLHLNVIGYTYQGEMFSRALVSEVSGTPFKPTIINSVEFVDTTTIKLKCSTPNGGGLAIDTSTLPAAPGYGISLQRPDLVEIVPTSVTVSGDNVTCLFSETVYPDFRLMVGYTLQDVTVDSVPGNTNYMPLTNIRGAIGNSSKAGNAMWYDWLMLDRHVVLKAAVGYVKPSTLGFELWRTEKVGLTDGFVSAAVFDGANTVTTRNGVTNAPITTVSYIDGSTNPELVWPIKVGAVYRVSGTCQVTSGAGLHEIRLTVGGVITKRTSTNSGTLGTFTVDMTATTAFSLVLQVNNVALVGQISNISVREVL